MKKLCILFIFYINTVNSQRNILDELSNSIIIDRNVYTKKINMDTIGLYDGSIRIDTFKIFEYQPNVLTAIEYFKIIRLDLNKTDIHKIANLYDLYEFQYKNEWGLNLKINSSYINKSIYYAEILKEFEKTFLKSYLMGEIINTYEYLLKYGIMNYKFWIMRANKAKLNSNNNDFSNDKDFQSYFEDLKYYKINKQYFRELQFRLPNLNSWPWELLLEDMSTHDKAIIRDLKYYCLHKKFQSTKLQDSIELKYFVNEYLAWLQKNKSVKFDKFINKKYKSFINQPFYGIFQAIGNTEYKTAKKIFIKEILHPEINYHFDRQKFQDFITTISGKKTASKILIKFISSKELNNKNKMKLLHFLSYCPSQATFELYESLIARSNLDKARLVNYLKMAKTNYSNLDNLLIVDDY